MLFPDGAAPGFPQISLRPTRPGKRWLQANEALQENAFDKLLFNTSGAVCIIEAKGREKLDIPQKMVRLRQWCEDSTAAEREEGGMGTRHDFLYVDQDSFKKHEPKSLADLAASFTEYKD